MWRSRAPSPDPRLTAHGSLPRRRRRRGGHDRHEERDPQRGQVGDEADEQRPDDRAHVACGHHERQGTRVPQRRVRPAVRRRGEPPDRGRGRRSRARQRTGPLDGRSAWRRAPRRHSMRRTERRRVGRSVLAIDEARRRHPGRERDDAESGRARLGTHRLAEEDGAHSTAIPPPGRIGRDQAQEEDPARARWGADGVVGLPVGRSSEHPGCGSHRGRRR